MGHDTDLTDSFELLFLISQRSGKHKYTGSPRIQSRLATAFCSNRGNGAQVALVSTLFCQHATRPNCQHTGAALRQHTTLFYVQKRVIHFWHDLSTAHQPHHTQKRVVRFLARLPKAHRPHTPSTNLLTDRQTDAACVTPTNLGRLQGDQRGTNRHTQQSATATNFDHQPQPDSGSHDHHSRPRDDFWGTSRATNETLLARFLGTTP